MTSVFCLFFFYVCFCELLHFSFVFCLFCLSFLCLSSSSVSTGASSGWRGILSLSHNPQQPTRVLSCCYIVPGVLCAAYRELAAKILIYLLSSESTKHWELIFVYASLFLWSARNFYSGGVSCCRASFLFPLFIATYCISKPGVHVSHQGLTCSLRSVDNLLFPVLPLWWILEYVLEH